MNHRTHDATERLRGWADRLPASARTGWCSVQGGGPVPTAEAPIAEYFPQDRLPEIVGHHAQAVEDAFVAWNGGSPAAAFDRV